ncbi:glycoside hydrolase family 2 protein [Rubrivirga marina]|uniref:Beta-glucuronidase n=1 Tax=Rubrivirga marina TaxID=1196024 RepID=A0A271IYI9_9BACT|nr:glycoside hydrolase family 2 TIM barrel-domain containing protein [Rubrivirga marina]PAP76326.1 beta-glucuronidase [Rubrivirga marina]
MSPRSIALALLVTAALPAATQTGHVPLVQHADGRAHEVLDGAWRVVVDPYDVGYRNIFDEPLTTSWFAHDAQETERWDRLEYDFDAADALHVPGDWNSQRPELFLYEGTVWYRRRVRLARAEDERLILRFGAVNARARVFFDGDLLAEHEGGYTPFDVEITDHVGAEAEDHSLVVMANDTRSKAGVPMDNMDWWNYGGITRSVRLLRLPATYVRDYSVQLDPEAPEEIVAWVALDGARLGQRVRVAIPELGAEASAQTDADGVARLRLPFRGERWAPLDPRLYDVVVEAETDRVEDRIGFRTVEVDGVDVLVNGEPVFLRGISIHEEAPFRGGRGLTPDEDRQLLEWATELGCNYVRLAHYPHNEAMVRAADEMGLLVWSEIPAYWALAWDDPATFASADQQLREMITRDKNRAAVVLWSVANETPVSPARTDFLTRLTETARALDPTRLITAAVFADHERQPDGSTVFRVEDPLAEHLDVVGVNEYVGWYDGLPDKIGTIRWEDTVGKPLVLSEFGAGALYGLRGDSLTRWSEDYQAYLYEEQLAMLRDVPFLRGLSPWILMDFRSPRRPLPTIQEFWNRKGLLSERGERKLAFGVLQRFYAEVARDWRPSPTGF